MESGLLLVPPKNVDLWFEIYHATVHLYPKTINWRIFQVYGYPAAEKVLINLGKDCQYLIIAADSEELIVEILDFINGRFNAPMKIMLCLLEQVSWKVLGTIPNPLIIYGILQLSRCYGIERTDNVYKECKELFNLQSFSNLKHITIYHVVSYEDTKQLIENYLPDSIETIIIPLVVQRKDSEECTGLTKLACKRFSNSLRCLILHGTGFFELFEIADRCLKLEGLQLRCEGAYKTGCIQSLSNLKDLLSFGWKEGLRFPGVLNEIVICLKHWKKLKCLFLIFDNINLFDIIPTLVESCPEISVLSILPGMNAKHHENIEMLAHLQNLTSLTIQISNRSVQYFVNFIEKSSSIQTIHLAGSHGLEYKPIFNAINRKALSMPNKKFSLAGLEYVNKIPFSPAPNLRLAKCEKNLGIM